MTPRCGRRAVGTTATAPWPRTDREHGAVALEAALVAPVVALLLAAVVALVPVLLDQLAIAHAARVAVRTYAVTGDRAAATTVVTRSVPGAAVAVGRAGRDARVDVHLDGRLLGVGYRLVADATARLEPGVG